MPETTAARTVDGAEPGAVLLTGATGFVGQEILCRYLTDSDRRIYTLVRAHDPPEADGRLRSSLDALLGDADAFSGRVSAVCGDILQPRLGLEPGSFDELVAEVTDIVHAAASVSFTLPLDEAREVNVTGTRHMVELAGACRRHGRGLRRFCHVSTAYVAGDHEGPFHEDELDVGQGFRNTYERSKFEAEHLVRERAAELPVVIVRPSIVVGERSHGWTSSFNVLYPPLKAFSRGAYPVVPAKRSTPVDIVPVDYVAEAIFELCEHDADEYRLGVFHLVSGEKATTVGSLIEQVSAYFRRRRPRTVPEPIYRRLLHPLLKRRGSERRRRALQRTEALFPYFSMRVRFDDRRARARLGRAGIAPPAPETYLERLLDFATAAKWGRNVPPRHEVLGGA